LTRFVLDCSVAMSWCFDDENNTYADQVLESLLTVKAIVPTLWPLEVANVLVVAERRKRLTEAQMIRAIALLQALPIGVDETTAQRALGATLTLAREHNLSAYDAAYLELAMREGLSLATVDAKLIQVISYCGVELYCKPVM
jgi:predicted nucleic acid-binding protein